MKRVQKKLSNPKLLKKSPSPEKILIESPKSPKPQPSNQTDLNSKFLSSIKTCSQGYNYTNQSLNNEEKSSRLQSLQYLHDFVLNPNYTSMHVIPHMLDLFQMIEKNIFRPLPVEKISEKVSIADLGIEI